MLKIVNTVIKAIPVLVGLFKSRTPQQGKSIIKSGVASLTISGLISTGRLTASEFDATLLLILSILETIGYLYGLIALSSGGAQISGLDQLLNGNGEGLREEQATALGRRWLKQIQKNQRYNLGSSLFDDDHSDLRISPSDISRLVTHNPNKNDR